MLQSKIHCYIGAAAGTVAMKPGFTACACVGDGATLQKTHSNSSFTHARADPSQSLIIEYDWQKRKSLLCYKSSTQSKT